MCCLHKWENSNGLDYSVEQDRLTRDRNWRGRLRFAGVFENEGVLFLGRLPDVKSARRGKSNSQRPGHVAWTRRFGESPWHRGPGALTGRGEAVRHASASTASSNGGLCSGKQGLVGTFGLGGGCLEGRWRTFKYLSGGKMACPSHTLLKMAGWIIPRIAACASLMAALAAVRQKPKK